ncbi:MAG: hypothetical protein NZ901_09010 [Geminocystis sp.]|nr:hypothetical protein [Geminocystis sp.]MCS7148315.1 hypothetical protein [Geminocystis sp.]HIK37358.1 hypothetical protein [Geminocystis sp. M7585_C2015_104]
MLFSQSLGVRDPGKKVATGDEKIHRRAEEKTGRKTKKTYPPKRKGIV